jgi:methylmalonyl-CoA carboxyltransferase small subunit
MGKSIEEGTSYLKLQITIGGKTYEAEVEVLEDDESPREPSYQTYQPVPAAPQPVSLPVARTETQVTEGNIHDEKICRSPVMGLVIKVNVKPGQSVLAGDLMMVLEAMKMETNVTAARTGIVKSVRVAPGESVKLNQIVVEFE